MIGPTPRTRPGGLPFGLLGALALIVACERVVVALKSEAMDAGLCIYDAAAADMAKNVRGAKVLCFGDSLIKDGVAPKVLEARAGLRGFNLAMAGSPAPASYMLLRRAIEAGARPEAVVVDYMPCLMAADPWPNITTWPFLATYADAAELAWRAGDPELFVAIAARKTFPSLACRESLRPNIMLTLRGFTGLNKAGVEVALRSWEVNRGLAMESYRFSADLPIEVLAKPLFSGVRLTPLNQYYIDKFMALAADHGVKVFWALPPHMPALQAYIDRTGYDARHAELVRSMMRRYPGLTVVDARRSGFDPRLFIDTHHLGFAGAHNYSEELAVVLRDRLDHPDRSSRWCDLPPYRDRPVNIRHEILDETRQIVLRDILSRARR